MNYFKFIKPFLYSLPAEAAHKVATWVLKHNLLPKNNINYYPNLANTVMGLNFFHPIGLAAGFDKNAECISGLLNQGFSFIETGTVTPKAQAGNPKPRMFRLTEDQAIINRLGFNNKGVDYFISKLSTYQKKAVVGVNIGKNKDTTEFIDDYIFLLRKLYPYSSYITLNVSSPNTPGLRDLQHSTQLQSLLHEVAKTRQELSLSFNKNIPILLKIAPDLSNEDIENIVHIALNNNINGIIISNTTIQRNFHLKSHNAHQAGGLSGKPLFNLSTQLLRSVYKLVGNKIALIGVGGVSSGYDAYLKILSGASLIQIYSSLIYNGFGVIESINKELSYYLERDGLKNITEAVGKDVT
ncbi:Dihydroorotate dehydrogenase (quinone) [Rickettsiales bacterium Ac37b]|nr:Dihydroorotate dehydrogenase (quinone) [Rickettsiales bacterium Ac37b]